MKKQVAKMEEYENWIGALSGKIKSIAPGGIVELEGAGVQIFEKKTTDKEVKSEGVAQAQEVSQTLNPEQLEKETKIQQLIATATSPRDKAFYQELLQKAIAERASTTVESSKAIDSEEEKITENQENPESSTEKNQPSEAIFQAVGVIEGEVESIDNKLKVSIGGESYDLKFVPGHKKRQWSKLKQEIEEKGSSLKTLMVYPQSNINKKGEVKISLALTCIIHEEKNKTQKIRK